MDECKPLDTDLPAKSVSEMREQAFGVMDAAWELGVRYFDAARSYGRSEEFLGAWLEARGISPEAVVVGSKWVGSGRICSYFRPNSLC